MYFPHIFGKNNVILTNLTNVGHKGAFYHIFSMYFYYISIKKYIDKQKQAKLVMEESKILDLPYFFITLHTFSSYFYPKTIILNLKVN